MAAPSDLCVGIRTKCTTQEDPIIMFGVLLLVLIKRDRDQHEPLLCVIHARW